MFSFPSQLLSIKILTPKQRALWPTEHYKALIDSLTRGGSKNNPLGVYPELARDLEPKVEERDGRYYLIHNYRNVFQDDTSFQAIIVERALAGDESISFSSVERPDVSSWSHFEFPFFGTIGNSKYEAQTYENRQNLKDNLPPNYDSVVLKLAFQLSSKRNNRDLDNLADALIPVFNSLYPNMTKICLYKANPICSESEFLRIAVDLR